MFINVPFDEDHEYLYIALIASLVAFDLNPRSVVEVPPSSDRLRRLVQVIRSCRYSLHDLSCVELSQGRAPVPRFNMPFELGLAVAIAAIDKTHDFRILEARRYRVQRSLSDSAGYECFVHGATPSGVFQVVSNVFHDLPAPFDTDTFVSLYRSLRRYRRERMPADIFAARAFGEIQLAARTWLDREVAPASS